MLIIVVQALFFFLPAYVANMLPVVFGRVRAFDFLKKPLDGGCKLGAFSLFGSHKTYFGFAIGVTGAIVIGFIQSLMFDYFPFLNWLFLFHYTFSTAALLGFLLGFGALLGDLLKSFVKRRLHLKDGSSFFPFDQLDFVFGGLCLGYFVYFPSWSHVLALVLLTPLLHLSSNVIGYKLGLKKVWW